MADRKITFEWSYSGVGLHGIEATTIVLFCKYIDIEGLVYIFTRITECQVIDPYCSVFITILQRICSSLSLDNYRNVAGNGRDRRERHIIIIGTVIDNISTDGWSIGEVHRSPTDKGCPPGCAHLSLILTLGDAHQLRGFQHLDSITVSYLSGHTHLITADNLKRADDISVLKILSIINLYAITDIFCIIDIVIKRTLATVFLCPRYSSPDVYPRAVCCF